MTWNDRWETKLFLGGQAQLHAGTEVKLESLREIYRGHFCLGSPRGRVVVIDKVLQGR